MKRFVMMAAAVAMGFATVNVQADAPAKYNQFCVACHAAGVAGAPKTGDKAAWDALLADGGMEKLISIAKQGLNAMPPMGLCASCTDADFKEIIEYMSK